MFNIIREVVYVDKKEDMAENTSLGDSRSDVDGGRSIALQEDLLCAVRKKLGGCPFNGPLGGMKYPTRTKSTTRPCVPY